MSYRAPRRRADGRLAPSQRRAQARILARLASHAEAYLRHDPEFRAARRLHEIGRVCAVASKSRPWMNRTLAEVTVFPTREAALKRYSAQFILPKWRSR